MASTEALAIQADQRYDETSARLDKIEAAQQEILKLLRSLMPAEVEAESEAAPASQTPASQTAAKEAEGAEAESASKTAKKSESAPAEKS